MRTVKAISPSAKQLWDTDRNAFYLRYLAESQIPRPPQTPAMQLGLSTDIHIKGDILEFWYGRKARSNFIGNELHRQGLSEDSSALGRQIARHYDRCGALSALIHSTRHARRVDVEHFLTAAIDGVPIHGYIDYWAAGPDWNVIHDWKVRGYFSSASPTPYYVRALSPTAKLKHYRDHFPWSAFGEITSGVPLNQTNPTYAQQLTSYGWLVETCAPSERPPLYSLDEICFSQKGTMRVALHRAEISAAFQHNLRRELVAMWDALDRGHIFNAVGRPESDVRCEQLERRAAQIAKDDYSRFAFNL